MLSCAAASASADTHSLARNILRQRVPRLLYCCNHGSGNCTDVLLNNLHCSVNRYIHQVKGRYIDYYVQITATLLFVNIITNVMLHIIMLYYRYVTFF